MKDERTNGMKIRQTKQGNMCEVRLKDRRVRVYRLPDKMWGVAFVRPIKACEGCQKDHSGILKTYSLYKGRALMTAFGLSHEAMAAFCDAVCTLLEFEKGGVEVRR